MSTLALLVSWSLVGCSEGVDVAGTASATRNGSGGEGSSSSSSTSASASTGTGSGRDAEWTVVPWWSGSKCVFESAQRPESAFPKLEWEACPAPPAGCERIKKTWPQQSPTGLSNPVVRNTGS
jgi:hypothetical protein